jgi:hypothetical protein
MIPWMIDDCTRRGESLELRARKVMRFATEEPRYVIWTRTESHV